MAILKIARMGHPVLRQRAAEVEDINHPQVHALVSDMMETLADIGGLGLAAPQVHVSQRVVVFHVPNDEGVAGTTVLINPEWEPVSDVMANGWEGCLSVPGLRGLVPRYQDIRYGGLSPTGEEISRTASGRHAVVVQHECDHLDGVLYPMRMTDMSQLVFETEFNRHLSFEADRQAEQEVVFEEG
jgi:peptide deformylase